MRCVDGFGLGWFSCLIMVLVLGGVCVFACCGYLSLCFLGLSLDFVGLRVWLWGFVFVVFCVRCLFFFHFSLIVLFWWLFIA